MYVQCCGKSFLGVIVSFFRDIFSWPPLETNSCLGSCSEKGFSFVDKHVDKQFTQMARKPDVFNS